MKTRVVIISLVMASFIVALVPATSTESIATRDLPDECVAPGEEFIVTITSPGTGQVIENLEDGLTYVGTSLEDYQVTISGNTISFTIINDKTFTYTVRAPDAEGTYHITGIFKDMDKTEYEIAGDTEICVSEQGHGGGEAGGESGEGEEIVPTRDLPNECVAPGAEFTVTITSPGVGQVIETLDEGLTYVDSSLGDYQVTINDNVITFTLAGDTTFTYTVRAPDTEGIYHITGIFKDLDLVEHNIEGDTEICVSEQVPCSDADFVLHLKAGWNLVSIPKPITPTDAVTLFNLSWPETAYYYDASSGKWINDCNIIVKPCQAYWVYKTKNEDICIYYDRSTLLPPSQQLYIGWNMIGHIDDTAWSIEDFLSVTGLENKCSIVCTVDHQGMPHNSLKLKCYYPTASGLSEFNTVLPGWGYWVFVKENILMPGTAP